MRIFYIGNPCDENWENMKPHETGRFCDSCQKTVIRDLNEAIPGKSCVRVDIKELLDEQPVPAVIRRFVFAILVAFSTGLFCFSSSSALAVVENFRSISGLEKNTEDSIQRVKVFGKIVEKATSSPLPFAAVYMKKEDTVKNSCYSDIDGYFQLTLNHFNTEETIEIYFKFIGFKDLTITIKQSDIVNNTINLGKITLEEDQFLLGDFHEIRLPIDPYDFSKTTIKRSEIERLPK